MADIQEAFYSGAALLRIEAPILIEVRPLAGLRASAEYKRGSVFVRVSDGYATAEREVVVGLALDLLSRLFRKPIKENAYAKAYKSFLRQNETHLLHKTLKQQRGKKRSLEAQGVRYNLNEVVATLVRENPLLQTLSIPRVGWSKKESFGRVGFYDKDAHEIVISKALDKKTVPFYIVEYVVFHELLHAKHPSKHNASKRTVHTREFKREEKAYPLFHEANEWLKQNDLAEQEI